MEKQRLSPVPEGYHTINPWVIPKGATELIQFLEKVFGAKETIEARTPDADGLLIHAEVRIGDSTIMIFDSKPDWPPTPAFLQVYVADATDVLERARGEGATVITELTDFLYGEKLGRFRDPWGNFWWINQRVKDVDWEVEAEAVAAALQASAQSGEAGYIHESLMRAMRHLGSR